MDYFTTPDIVDGPKRLTIAYYCRFAQYKYLLGAPQVLASLYIRSWEAFGFRVINPITT